MRNFFLLALAMFFLPAAAGAAREIHVNNVDGDDRFTGHQPQATPDQAGPVRTIAKALRLATSGDHVVLAKTAQPYRESISLVGSRHSGQPYRAFVIEGNGAILDGSVVVPPQAWEPCRGAIFRFRPPQMGYQQLFLDDRPAVRVPVSHQAAGPPELEPRQWCFFDGQIYFCVEPTKLPEDYRVSCAGLRTGITLYHVEHVGIVDLTVQGFQLDGISVFNSARGVYLAEVICRGNGRSGISVGGASRVEIEASLLGNNARAQLLTLPCSETHVRRSRLLSNTAPGWVEEGGRLYVDQRRLEGGLDEIKAGKKEPRPRP